MEVLLESCDGHNSLKNTFVSMRIGDVQKQSRFSEPRKYVFPDPGENRQSFGRIEVFKRVGFTTVNFENFQGKPQNIEVPCDGPDDRLRLKVQVNSNLKVDPQLEKVGKTKARLDAATKYLQDHRLEEILADAMRDVIHDRPVDPLTFLSSKLLANLKTPPRETKPAAAPAQKVEASKPAAAKSAAGPLHTMITVLPNTSLTKLYAKFPLSPEAAKATAKALQGSPTAFKTMPAGAFTGIHSKFASFAKAEATVAAAAAKPSGGPNKEFGKLASVGTWLAPKPKGPKGAAAGTVPNHKFVHTPSVGSWLAPAPLKKEQDVPTYRGWTLRPSVGTWLAPKPDNAEDLGASTLTLYADEDELLHSMSGEELIKVFRQQLKKKDEELLELKRSMGRSN
jgi:hypothetical protein